MKLYFKKLKIFFLSLGILCIFGIPTSKKIAAQDINSHQIKKNANLYFTNTEYDFGQITQGEKPAATFYFRNTGSKTLNIDRVLVNIRNLIAVISDNSFGPGEEGTIEVILDSTAVHGRILGQIAIFANGQKEPATILQVSADIEPILAFEPSLIFVGQVAKDASYQANAMLMGKLIREKKLTDYEIRTSSPAIEVKMSPLNENSREAILRFVIHPELKAGTFEETVTFVSQNPPVQAQLKIQGQKLGIVKFTPDRFEFFPREGKMPKKIEILFECEKIFKITKVEDLTQSLKISLKTIEKGKKYRLTAKLKQRPKEGLLGVVKIYTDLEEYPLIHIPVIGSR